MSSRVELGKMGKRLIAWDPSGEAAAANVHPFFLIYSSGPCLCASQRCRIPTSCAKEAFGHRAQAASRHQQQLNVMHHDAVLRSRGGVGKKPRTGQGEFPASCL